MGPENVVAGLEPRIGAGETALQVGAGALVAAFIPIIGDFITVPAALVAMVLGTVGYRRTEKGVATNAGQAITGGFLGLAAGFTVLITYLITSTGP